MPIFQYRAINQQNQIVKGLVEAGSHDAVAELLGERHLTIVSLKESDKTTKMSLPFFDRVKHKSVVIFSRQLAVMIAATVPIVQALRIIVNQTDDKKLQEVITTMTNDVDGGMKMSSAFAKHPQVFSHFYVAMLKSGETSGRLEKVLNYLADQMEKDYDLSSRIKGAMVYPLFIITAMLGLAVVMMIFVIPKMTEMLTETGTELPFTTKVLIGTSHFMVSYWWVLLLGLILLVVGIQALLRTDIGKSQWDESKLHIPIVGNLIKKIVLTRFARSLSTLIRGGVPISRALKITEEVVSNKVFQVMISKTVKEVEDGNSITTVLSQSKLVPAMVPQMMAVGERTGRMDDVLERLGDFYAREVDNVIGTLTSLIEPVIMIILGVGVGFMVSAIILPIFQIANNIK